MILPFCFRASVLAGSSGTPPPVEIMCPSRCDISWISSDSSWRKWGHPNWVTISVTDFWAFSIINSSVSKNGRLSFFDRALAIVDLPEPRIPISTMFLLSIV